MVRLGDVCTFYSGTGFPNIYQGKADGKYPFYKVGDISRNVLSGNRELKICENYIDDDTVTKIKGTLLPPQTVVFAKIGEALRLNRRAITSRDCLVDNNAMGIKSDDSIIDSLYFYYFMCNVDLQNYCESTTVPSVRKTRIAEIEIPLPPLDEQRRIAAVLDKVSDLIAKRREQLDKLDELVKARFVEMFGDPLCNTKNWSCLELTKACKAILGGGTPSKSHPEYFMGTIPWVSPKDMKQTIINDSIDHITEEAIANSTTNLIPRNSVLMVIRSGILKHPLPVAINNVPVTINQDMKAFVPDNAISTEFLIYYFKAIEPDVLAGVRGVTADNIDFKAFQKRKIIVPPIDLQRQFVIFVKRINISKLTIQQSLDKLEVLKKALMQQYFG